MLEIVEGSRVQTRADLGWYPWGPPAGGPHVEAGSVGEVRDVTDRGYFIKWSTSHGVVYRLCDFKEEGPLLELVPAVGTDPEIIADTDGDHVEMAEAERKR